MTTVHLPPHEQHRAMRLAMVDGVLYALMVGTSEMYFTADAVRLGATPLEQGLVVSLPLFAAGIGPVTVLRLLRGRGHRRGLVVTAVAGQAALLLALAALNWFRVLTPTLLIGAVCCYQVLGQGAGTAWASWFGDLVPEEERARYFARRTRLVQLTIFVGLMCGGLLLQFLERTAAAQAAQVAQVARASAGGDGFALLFLLGGVARAISAGLVAASPEPPFRGLPQVGNPVTFLRRMPDQGAWRLVASAAAVNFMVYVASPFFTPFMLERLEFSYAAFMVATGAQVLFKVLFIPSWGKALDRHPAAGVYSLAALLASLVPLPWLWVSGLPGVVAAQAWSGFAWGGYEVCLFTCLVSASTRETRPLVFACQSVGNGLGQLLGGLVGALIMHLSGEYRLLFGLSLLGRVAVAAAMPRVVAGSVAGAGRSAGGSTGRLLLWVIGYRPDSGLNHRPVPEPRDAEDAPAADRPIPPRG